ncbi:MAG: hypothetical protein K0S66_1501 [Sphingomonas sp.]|jgi:hypothetical protein|nr:hypothetical protein [Sphingomonas sp.]
MIIERGAGAAATGLLAVGAATAAQPATASFFGMPFEIATAIAAMFGCIVTRVIVGQSDKVSRWRVRVPIDVLSGGVTFFLVVATRPSLLTALVLGITVAALGASIIKIAEVRGRKLIDALLPGGVGDDDHEAGIARAMDQLHRIPDPEKHSG